MDAAGGLHDPDAGDLTVVRPGLVYAHASGWGDRPEARHLVGTDFLVQAYAGLGYGLHPDGDPPFPSRIILCDLFGALVTAEGILAALYRRQRTGAACEVRSSLLAGAMSLQAHVLDGRRARPVWGALDRPIATADGHLMVSADDGDMVDVARLGDRSAVDWEELLTSQGVPAAAVCEDLAAVPADPRFADLFEPAGPGRAPREPWSFR